jgi:cytochrome c553
MSRHFLNVLVGAALAAVLASGAPAALAQQKKPASKAPAAQESKPAAQETKPAAVPERRQGVENMHAMCIGCHGIPGYKTAFPDVYHVPKIAGQQAGYIVAALKAYKSGERSHPSMRGIAGTLTEEDMKEIAAYYAGGSK